MLPTEINDCIAFWDFQHNSLQSKGDAVFTLLPNDGVPSFAEDGIFGPGSLILKGRIYYSIPYTLCDGLNRAKENSVVTVMAWIKRKRQISRNCEAIAGMWNETDKKRQYCLFLNIRVTGGKDSVSGHVSNTGGPSVGRRYCEDVSVGKTPVPFNRWCVVAFSYDGIFARSYFNGSLDTWDSKNPYYYPGRLYDAGKSGSDFTVGAVDRSGSMGNWFRGLLGGLAVYRRALSEDEIMTLAQNSERY